VEVRSRNTLIRLALLLLRRALDLAWAIVALGRETADGLGLLCLLIHETD
jgi:hypothetical protein